MDEALIPPPRLLVRYWAEKTPERVAVVTADGETLSYAELGARIANVSRLLRDSGVDTGVRVGLALPNGLEYIIGLFGVFEAGGVAIPLDPKLPPEEAKVLLEECRSKHLIVSCNSPAASLFPETLSVLTSNTLLRGDSACHMGGDTETAALLLQFTSGSTGRPKRLLRAESQLFEDYRHFAEGIGLGADARFLALAPFFHAYGALGMYAAFSVGGVILPLGRFLPAEVLKKAESFRPTLLMTTPPMIEMLGKCFLKEDQSTAFASVRHTICSTGYLGFPAYERFFKRFGLQTRIQYGSTETLSASVTPDAGYKERRVGKPYPGVEVCIFDDNGKPVPANTVGRVGIKSPGGAPVYDDSGESPEQIDGFVLPGDLGLLDSTGEIYLQGRDDIYNIGGYKVSRGEVESLIRSAFDVGYVAVLPYSRAGQPSLRALIESDQADLSPATVTKICREKLAPYKVPSRIDIYAKLPRDANGKVKSTDLEML